MAPVSASGELYLEEVNIVVLEVNVLKQETRLNMKIVSDLCVGCKNRSK